MKKIILTVILLISAAQSFAQEGIQFTEGQWKEVLQKAKAEKKLVFIDIYTSWCGPCRLMAAEVFPKKEVGELFNASFINYRIDAEKGEGKMIAKDYVVGAYPTYLFVNGEGTLVYRSSGSMSAPAFIAEASNAVKEKNEPVPLAEWTREYEAGKRDKEFLMGYLKKRTTRKLPSPEIIEQLFPLLDQGELREKAVLSMIYENNQQYIPEGKAYNYGLKNHNLIDSINNTKFTLPIIYNGILFYASKTIIDNKREKDLFLAEKSMLEICKVLKDNYSSELLAKALPWKYYARTNNLEKFIPVANAFYNNYFAKAIPAVRIKDKVTYQKLMEPYVQGTRDSTKITQWAMTKRSMGANDMVSFSYTLRDLAIAVYNLSKDREFLLKATEWARLSDQYFPHFSNKAVYAGMLFKTGQRQKAIDELEIVIKDDYFIANPEKRKLYEDNLAEMKRGVAPVKLW